MLLWRRWRAAADVVEDDEKLGVIFVGRNPILSWPLTLGVLLNLSPKGNFSTKPVLTFSSWDLRVMEVHSTWAAGSALLPVFGRISHDDDSQSCPAPRRSTWPSSVAASVE